MLKVILTQKIHNPAMCILYPLKFWWVFFLALVALTVLTVEAAKFDVGSADVIVSMAIATVKASLVVFIFMHLWYDKPVNKIAFFFSIVFAAFFLCMILLDSHAYDDYVQGVPTGQGTCSHSSCCSGTSTGTNSRSTRTSQEIKLNLARVSAKSGKSELLVPICIS